VFGVFDRYKLDIKRRHFRIYLKVDKNLLPIDTEVCVFIVFKVFVLRWQ